MSHAVPPDDNAYDAYLFGSGVIFGAMIMYWVMRVVML
jgi:hypothetical protein